MLKNILNIGGAQQITKSEQKEINGGITPTTGCRVGGWRSTLNACLCHNGYWSNTTQRCIGTSASYTGNIYENATGCCYSQIAP